MSQEKTHICHLVYCFDIGGLERVILNCVNNLDADRFNHTIISLTYTGEFINQFDVPIKHYALNKKQGNDISVHFRLYKLLHQLKPDVLHTYNLATIEYQWVGLLARVPLRIHAEHGRDSYDPEGIVRKYQLIRKFCSYVIHHVIAVSEDLKVWLRDTVKIPERKLELLVNGVDTHYYHSDDSNVSEVKYDIGENKFIFGHVARLHTIKNQKFMLDAFRTASEKSVEFKENSVLVLVGDGPERVSLEQSVAENVVLKGRVLFAGSQSDVRSYYQSFDVFLMSSLAEGVPMTLLESMAMSIPHLVTSVGGIKEVVIPGETGLAVESEKLADYSDALLELYHNDDVRISMASRSRKRVLDKFDQETVISNYGQLYLGDKKEC